MARLFRYLKSHPKTSLKAYLILLAFVGYFISLAPGISLWDSPEFSAAINQLGIPHPPGTPMYMIAGKFWDLLFSFFVEPAFRHNLLSLFSALVSLLLLFDIALIFARNFFKESNLQFGVALGAPMLLSFSKTFWFNAVETEVYAPAMAIMLLEAWLVLSIPQSSPLLQKKKGLLFIYVSVLGIGVHMYSMLLFLPLYMILGGFWNKIRFGKTGLFLFFFIFLSASLGFAIPALSEKPWFLLGAATISIMLIVLGFRLGEFKDWAFWVSGLACLLVIVNPVWFYVSVCFLLLFFTCVYLYGKKPRWLFPSLSLLLVVVAYSHQMYLPLRSSLNPYLNENNPQSWSSFLETLERKQYGSENMLSRMFHRRGAWSSQLANGSHIGFLNYQWEQYFNLNGVLPFKSLNGMLGAIVWGLSLSALWGLRKKNKNWAMYLLCMYSLCSLGLALYMNFSDGSKISHQQKKRWLVKAKESYELLKTKSDNLPEFPDPDKLAQTELLLERFPEQRSEWLSGNRGKMFMEFIQLQNMAKNQGLDFPRVPKTEHREVRERDYFFVPAFIWFSLIFSLMLAVFWKRLGGKNLGPVPLVVSSLLWVPGFASHFNSNNRRGDYVAENFAMNCLISCPPDAVLYTNGDNDTFPLWYLQSVKNIRPDVRIINFSLSNLEWYVRQLAEGKNALSLPNVLKDSGKFPETAWYKFSSPQRLKAPGDSSLYVVLGKDSQYELLDVQTMVLMDVALYNGTQRPVCFNIMTPSHILMGLDSYFEERGLVSCISKEPGFNLPLLDSLLLKEYVYDFSARFSQRKDYWQLTWPYKSLVEKAYEAHISSQDEVSTDGKIKKKKTETPVIKEYRQLSKKMNFGVEF